MRRNLYSAHCRTCQREFGAGEGWFRLDPRTTVRTFYCATHANECGPIDAPILLEPDVPAPEPEPAEATTPIAIDETHLAKAVAEIGKATAAHFMAHVPTLVKETMLGLTREVSIQVGTAPRITVKQSHAMLPTVLQALTAGASPFLVGPAGSGKTTLAEQCATVLKRKFYMAARVTSEFKLTGFINATGNVVRTQFREAYEHGGVFLFDEVDASDPDAMTAFNAALSNGYADFPDGMVRRHANFCAIAAGNTFGRGADRQYVGRNQLDAATLDRFQVFEVDYDEALELQLAGNAEWTRHVQAVRAAIDAEKVRHIVSPRASIQGARMLASGMERSVVEAACIWKGLPADARTRVEARLNLAAERLGRSVA